MLTLNLAWSSQVVICWSPAAWNENAALSAHEDTRKLLQFLHH